MMLQAVKHFIFTVLWPGASLSKFLMQLTAFLGCHLLFYYAIFLGHIFNIYQGCLVEISISTHLYHAHHQLDPVQALLCLH